MKQRLYQLNYKGKGSPEQFIAHNKLESKLNSVQGSGARAISGLRKHSVEPQRISVKESGVMRSEGLVGASVGQESTVTLKVTSENTPVARVTQNSSEYLYRTSQNADLACFKPAPSMSIWVDLSPPKTASCVKRPFRPVLHPSPEKHDLDTSTQKRLEENLMAQPPAVQRFAKVKRMQNLLFDLRKSRKHSRASELKF